MLIVFPGVFGGFEIVLYPGKDKRTHMSGPQTVIVLLMIIDDNR